MVRLATSSYDPEGAFLDRRIILFKLAFAEVERLEAENAKLCADLHKAQNRLQNSGAIF